MSLSRILKLAEKRNINVTKLEDELNSVRQELGAPLKNYLDAKRKFDRAKERTINAEKLIQNAVMATPIEQIVNFASNMGYTVKFGPTELDADDLADFKKSNGLFVRLYFKKSTQLENSLVEKILNHATYCLVSNNTVCVMSKEGKKAFYEWMSPVMCAGALSRGLIQFDYEDNAREALKFNKISPEMSSELETLKDNPDALLKRAREQVLGNAHCFEGFNALFYIKNNSQFTYGYNHAKLEKGIILRGPYGLVKPSGESLCVKHNGQEIYEREYFIEGKPKELLEPASKMIAEWDSIFQKVRKGEDGYVMDFPGSVLPYQYASQRGSVSNCSLQ